MTTSARFFKVNDEKTRTKMLNTCVTVEHRRACVCGGVFLLLHSCLYMKNKYFVKEREIKSNALMLECCVHKLN